MIPLLHIEEVRGSTTDLAELLQKHAFHGKKSTFPEDAQERQKMCVRKMDVLATCVMEVKRGIRSLQSKIDALEEVYTSENSKALKKLMVKELEAYEEEISFFHTIGDAELFVYTLEDYMMECEIQLALMKNRKIFASLSRNKNEEQTFVTDQSPKEKLNVECRKSRNAENSILDAQGKPRKVVVDPAILSFDDSWCAMKIEAENSLQINSTKEATNERKTSNSSDGQYSEKAFSVHNEASLQVMTPPVSSEVETAVSKSEDLPAPTSKKKITPTEQIAEFNFILFCHIRFHIIIDIYFLQSPAFCLPWPLILRGCQRSRSVHDPHQRPLLYPDKKKDLRKGVDCLMCFCHALSLFFASCSAGGSVPIESAPLSPPPMITMKVMHKHDLL